MMAYSVSVDAVQIMHLPAQRRFAMFASSSTAIALDPGSTARAAAGDLLGGKYQLERVLGEGGMGSVWLARNVMLDFPVALKVVRHEVRGRDTSDRLLTEARVEASLGHPNVVRVFDCGVSEAGDAYIVMELLEGWSLGELIHRQGALPAEFAVQLLLPVIDALSTAHQAGIVHRDLKPDNIFIASTGTQLCPKIVDFGIAKLSGQTFNPRATGENTVMGSPAYMAPEQARGLADVDQRADVWAICVVLYEAITGRTAFDADNYNALLHEVLERELPPLTGPALESLWAIVKRGLIKERDGRIPTMRALGTELAAWLLSRGLLDDAAGEPLAWHWQIDPRAATPAGRILAAAMAMRWGGSSTGERSNLCTARTQRFNRPSKVRWRSSKRNIALAACFGLNIVLLGSMLSSSWRERAIAADQAGNPPLVKPAVAAAALAPPSSPEPTREARTAPETGVLTSGTAPGMTRGLSERRPDRATTAPGSKKRTARAQASALGLKNPW